MKNLNFAVILMLGFVSSLFANGIVERGGQLYDLDMLNSMYILEYLQRGSFDIDEPVIIEPKVHNKETFKNGLWYFGVPGVPRISRTFHTGSTMQFSVDTWNEEASTWLKARYIGEKISVSSDLMYTLLGTFSFVDGKAVISLKYIEPFDENLYFNSASDSEGQGGDLNEEITYYKALLVSDPYNAAAHNNLAYTYALAGDPLSALFHITRAMELTDDPDDPAFLDTRGYVAYLLGDYDDAIADYDHALSNPNISDTSAAETYYHRSQAYIDKAKADLQKALELDPSYKEAAQALEGLGS